ncbi:hypothetical protein [Burkholderia pyrrocinia]
MIFIDHGRAFGTVDMWIARISSSSAALPRARIIPLTRNPATGQRNNARAGLSLVSDKWQSGARQNHVCLRNACIPQITDFPPDTDVERYTNHPPAPKFFPAPN